MKIDIYSKDNCVYCDQAKALLSSKGLLFNEYKIGGNITKAFFMEQFPHVRSVPLILIDGEEIGGYNALREWAEITGGTFLLG